ncbi:MAG: NAD-dependent epimerase/dehydratase family protein [Clostridiales bacterium]|nr:NAD-dependent epimerase/dehydratase family protein [Clostridiales bacterium]
MLENKPVNIFEDGKESRDFIHVKDVAAAIINSVSNVNTNSKIINLGSGIGTSVKDIATILKHLYHSNSKINITGDFRIGDIAHNVADTSKAKQLIDFTPSISLLDGLAQFANWVSSQEIDNTNYEKSLEEMECAGMFVRGQVS